MAVYTNVQKAQDAVDLLLSLEPELVANVLLKEHRTNQQSVMGNLYTLIDYVSEAYHNKAYDMRNEDALNIANSMSAAKIELGYSERTRLPYV
jgi:hypothetical protein